MLLGGNGRSFSHFVSATFWLFPLRFNADWMDQLETLLSAVICYNMQIWKRPKFAQHSVKLERGKCYVLSAANWIEAKCAYIEVEIFHS